jgi:glycosyltransferase involved in cell wall biosynthesis
MFTRYSELGASSRYRYYMYAQRLRDAEEQVKVNNFFDDKYLHALYNNEKTGIFNIFKSYFRRVMQLICAEKFLVIEYELLPFIPYWVERMFLSRRKYILNFDDNVWEKYKDKKNLSDKYDDLVRNADGIIVANDFLYDKVISLNKNVIKIPTVVDLDLYKSEKAKFEKFTLVWIGTPVTYVYLESFAETLRKMAEKYDFELLVIAKKNLKSRQIEGVKMRFEDWSSQKETEFLARSHAGIMPLTNDAFSQGKSAFKLIQYAAAGLPVIASPVGENLKVVKNNQTGFLPETNEDWLEALEKLINDQKLYNDMSENARTASKDYSIQKYYQIFYKFCSDIE